MSVNLLDSAKKIAKVLYVNERQHEKVFVVLFAGNEFFSLNELETVYDEDDTHDHNEDRSLDSNDPSTTLADVPVDSGIVKIQKITKLMQALKLCNLIHTTI